MFKYRFIVKFCLSFLLLLGASSAFAQATRTWISGVGDDVNPCSRTAPCKTFAGAISKTASGGIIDVLDPGGFGAVTITKPITLESVGNVGSILSSGVNGIIINTPGATDTVVLRGLSIDGAGTTLGTNGVRVLAVGKLVIDHCTIQNYSTNGIDFEPSTANAVLAVNDTTINSNATAAGATSGIFVQAVGAAAALDHVRVVGNNLGLQVRTGTVSVHTSTISANTVANIKSYAIGAGVNAARIDLDNTLVANSISGIGIIAQGGNSTVWMSNSTITGNNTGILAISGIINSFGNNRLFGNTTADGTPTATLMQK